MNGKMWIALLLTVSFALFSPLVTIAAVEYKLLSEDKLKYKKGGPKAATISLPTQTATPPPETPKEAPKAKPQEKSKAKPKDKPKASPMPAKRSAPSFNCAKASNTVERAICADPVLAEMDVSMAADYKKALKAVADEKALRTEQRQWLRQMHRQCDNGAFQCIQQYYGTRSTQLRSY